MLASQEAFSPLEVKQISFIFKGTFKLQKTRCRDPQATPELIWQVHIAQQSIVQICQVELQGRIIMFSWHSTQGYIVSGSVLACMESLHCFPALQAAGVNCSAPAQTPLCTP